MEVLDRLIESHNLQCSTDDSRSKHATESILHGTFVNPPSLFYNTQEKDQRRHLRQPCLATNFSSPVVRHLQHSDDWCYKHACRTRPTKWHIPVLAAASAPTH